MDDADLEFRLIMVTNAIKNARNNRGIGQRELARLINMSPAALNKIENGSGNMRLSTLFKIANALQYPPSILLQESVEGVVVESVLIDLSPERRMLLAELALEMKKLQELENEREVEEEGEC
ncbi:MAG TPA: hypothetical protein DCE42_12815 [Myxococcales bacterium]|nr:hypothetical protein [Deltaproteobacteria bacterium]MBK07369.1 hypothetical protein [Deltaproteobacteria bacterium]MBU53506.1 hypothetical protein [Deltaproteobacteria bacterium]HAA55636.1 hypothetical protein [Myxococcales bacterium]|tara:strand:- start:1909 stop:2274 length:366 start_codon:yes stop_codon:yes gene_type:complete